ncbi:hypothetical protein FHR89_001618 [Cellulomonas uda]|nr:hypothetical protein [Cellulomonas uda]
MTHSHAAIDHENTLGCSTARTVLATDPTHTTNITG